MIHTMVAVAPGSEEIELVALTDTLRRGGFSVDVVSIGDELNVECSRGVTIVADKLLSDVNIDDYQLLVLPGGANGAEFMSNTSEFIDFIRQFYQAPRYLAAMCAAPAIIIHRHQIASQAIMTCHPDFYQDLPPQWAREERVVVDSSHRLITSRAPGTAIEMGLAILEQLGSKELAQQVAKPMLIGEELPQRLR